jgi:hypothetical protein
VIIFDVLLMILGGQERLLNVKHLIFVIKIVLFNVILSDGIVEKAKKDLVHGICSNVMIQVKEKLLQLIISFFFLRAAGESSLIKLPSYQPTTGEWPLHAVEIERERLLKGVDALMQMDVAEQFRAPGN